MVVCPFCNKAIEAPAKIDVIFECPHCHKKLITYDKREIDRKNENETTFHLNSNSQETKNYSNTKKEHTMPLIYCKDCGKQISSYASTCPFCGCPQNETSSKNEIHLGYLLISFLIPLIGIILCCISWDKDDGKTKSALIGALIGIIFTAIIYSIL